MDQQSTRWGAEGVMMDKETFTNDDGIEVDKYGNPTDGDSLPFCCFPDCGCDGARLCMAKSGANRASMAMNFERRGRPINME